MKENKKLVNEIISDVKHDMSNEDIISLLADSRISANPDKEKYTFGQRAADKIAKFAGSWAFIFSFSALLILWMVGNVILAKRAFDPYPFILLNLVLSCVAALQAPLIMMSQNRQEEKDRRRAEKELLPPRLLRCGKSLLRGRGRGSVDRRGGLGVTLFRLLKAQKLIDAHAVETAELHELAQLGLSGARFP